MEAYLMAQAAKAFDYLYGFIQGGLVPLLAALIGAIVGGAMAGWGACRAVKKDYKLRTQREEKQARDELRAYYQALKTEMKFFWEACIVGWIREIDKGKRGGFLGRVVPKTELFTIYRANTAMLTKVPKAQLRKQIIRVYGWCQNLYAESVRCGQESAPLLEEPNASPKARQAVWTDYLQARQEAVRQAADFIKEDSQRLAPEVKELLAALEKEIESLT